MRYAPALTTLIALVILCATSALAEQDVLRLALPGEGHLSSAVVAEDGPTLLAWESTKNRWSKIQVLQGGQVQHEWELSDALIKGARWITPGKRLLVFAVIDERPEDRVYSITKSGELRQEWSSRSVAERYEVVSFSEEGSHWIGADFVAEHAEVALGQVGESTPLWTWRLDADTYGTPDPIELDEASYTISWNRPGNLPDVGILWGARLWLARPTSEHLVRVIPPEGCSDIHGATATRDGLWIECHRGMNAKPSHSWAYYPGGFGADVTSRQPSLVETFRAPRFLADGTVLDMHSRAGTMVVHEVAESGAELKHLGDLDVPAGVRVLDAGDSLLVEMGDLTDEFRVLPLKQEVTSLKQDAARANK